MADASADIIINVDTSIGISEIKNLQRAIAQLNTQLIQSGAQQAKAAQNIQRNLINNINATGKFAANVRTISTTAESFTTALEKNKLSMGEYFRYAGASTKTFGRLFKNEFGTIEKVARERVKTLQTQYIKLGRDANGAMKAISVRPLALDMDNLATKTAIAAQKQQLFNQLMKQGSTNLLNFGKNTQWAGRQLMVGFSIPLAYLGSIASKTFMQMEEQALKFKRVYGELFTSQAETDAMVAQIQELAKEFTKYGVTAAKTMEMAAEAAAMGKMGADLLAQVTESTRLAVLGNVEASQALETTISVTNAFGIATEELANKIDFLNAVENQTVTSIEDLTIAIPKAAPVIQQLGGDVEDLAFFLTAMKEGGINASEGANALKSGLASLINPTNKASEFLAQFGVNVKGIVEANKGDVKGLVVDFASALDTLDPLNRARAIEQMFGKFQFSRLSTLFQNVVQEGTQAQRVLKLANATTEELAILSERELKRVEDSPMYKFKAAVEDLKVSLIPLGEAFLKAVTPIVEFAKGFLDKFNEMGDGAKQFAVIATTVVAGIGPILLMTFGLIANGVANLIKMFTAIGSIFTKTGSGSQALGMQTEYMTQQQLEAAAVAASLDQTHMKLSQTFTAETAAVNTLAAAYGKAILAQERLLGVGAGIGATKRGGSKAPSPKKYKSGVVSVPGPKGAGDIVPAMLAPGEAVIPAKQSQKYSGLIQGMINDDIPGYRFGLNPFATMLRNSRVTTRMKSEDLKAMLKNKDFRYKSAFETKTGDDYLNRITGRPKTSQQLVRKDMEKTVMGIRGDAPASSRPTYGSVELTPMGRILSRLFGLSGKQFRNIAKPGNKYLDIYGNADLVGKKSLNKRSSIFSGDLLRSFDNASPFYRNQRNKMGPEGSMLPPMRGMSKKQLEKQFGHFRHPFGKGILTSVNPDGSKSYISNPGYPYVEAHVAGGFGLKEISKIRVPSRKEARELQKLVDQAGLKIKVTPQNAPMIVKAISNIFGTRFSKGTTGEYKFDPSEKLVAAHLQDSHYLDSVDPEGRALVSQFKDSLGADKKFDESKLSKDVRDKIKVYGSLTADLPVKLNEGLKRPNGVSLVEFEKAWLGTENKLKETIARGIKDLKIDISEKDLAIQTKQIESEILKNIKNQSVDGRVDDALLSRATKKALLNVSSPVSKILQARATTLRERRSSYDKPELIRQIRNGTLQIVLNKNGSGNIVDKSSGLVVGRLDNRAGLTRQQQMQTYLSLDEKGRSKFLEKMGIRGDSKFIKQSTNSIPVDLDSPPPPKPEKKLPKKPVATPAPSKPQSQMSDILQRAASYGAKPQEQKPKKLRKFGKWFLPGYANGVVSVPGQKGKGDVVPAMLSPGEAVIPAKLSEKYAPLISGMISDSIPGYFEGFDGNNQVPKNPFLSMPNQTPVAMPTDPFGYPQSTPSIPVDEKSASRAGKILNKVGFDPKAIVAGASGIARSVGTSAVNAFGRTVAGENAVGAFLKRKGEEQYAKAQAQASANRAAGSVVQTGNRFYQIDDNGNKVRMTSAAGQAAMAQQQQQQQASAKDLRKEKFAQGAQRAGMMGMGLSMASSAAMMLPGEAGKVAGDIAPLMIGLSTLAMFIQGPVSAALVALVAAVGLPLYAMFKANEAFNEAQKNAMLLAESLGAGDQAMKKFADFAGNVTAGEIMDKRRSEKLGMFQIKTGKTTFGQSFMQGEEGQGLLANVTKSIEQGGRAQGIASLKSQMASAVASGALDAAQARSIVANLAEQLGDYSLGMQVNAELISLLGPNGENLAKDPLQVRVKMLDESQKRASDAMANANKLAGDDTLGLSGQGWRAMLGGAAAGAGVGAAIGAAIGTAILPGIGTGIGAVIGTGVGLISGGITGAIMGNQEHQEDVAEASGASVALQQIALEQQQQMSDSLELEYEQRIAAADAAGDLVEKEKLLKELQEGRVKILEENQQLNKQIMDSYSTAQDQDLKNALMSGADKAIEARYKEGPMADVAKLAGSRIKDSKLAEEQKYLLKLQVASGEIDPIQMLNILSMPEGSQNRIINIIGKYGGAFTSQVSALTGMFVDKDGNPIEKIQTDFLAKVDAAKTSEEAAKILDFYQKVAQSGAVLDTAVTVDFLMNNPEAAEELQKKFDALYALKGPITVEVLTKVLGEKELEAINDDIAYFNELSDEEKKVYTQVLATTLQTTTISDPRFKNWLSSEGQAFANDSDAKQLVEFAQWNARTVTETSMDTTTGAIPPENTGSGGGKPEDPYEDILKRLKEVREASVNASGGLKELNKWLGGSKNMKQFMGLEQQLMKRGANRGFIDYLLGLDKDIQKKFISVKNGIVSITAAGKAMAKAFNEIAIGEFQISLKQASIDATNQSIAYRKLTSAGMSTAEALKAIEDPALAAAVASKSISSEELKALASAAKDAADKAGRVAAKLQLIKDIQDEASRIEVQDRFRIDKTKFSEIEQFAISTDSTLLDTYSQFLAGEIKSLPKEFSDRLAQLTNSIDLKEAFFEDGFSKAMEAFAAQEEQLRITMELDLENFNIEGLDKKFGEGARDILANAQNEIAGLQYKIDDYQAGLQEIEWQEEAINEKYDKKFEALDKIEKANSRIANQQKSQLTLADALSQGDIAAAARAAQEMRAQSAQDAISSQRDTLDASREKELEALKSKSGMTRKQLDAAILEIQKQIFYIEESRLEPAAEAVRKAEAKLAADTAALTVAGKTKLEWDAIKNSIDIAKTSSDAYLAAINAALGVVESIKAYWDGLDGRTITTTHKIITVHEDGGGAGSGGDSGGSSGSSGDSGGSSDGTGSGNDSGDGSDSSTINRDAPINDIEVINANRNAPIKDIEVINAPTKQPAPTKQQKADQATSLMAAKAVGVVSKDGKLTTSADTAEKKITQGKTAYIPGRKVTLPSAIDVAKNSIKAGSLVGTTSSSAGEANKFANLAAKPSGGGGGTLMRLAGGGLVKYMSNGGLFKSLGTDIVPAMLTPGEFVVKKYAVDKFGVDNLRSINRGQNPSESVYNYEVNVNVATDANPDQIARSVITEIKRIDSQKIRGNRF